MLVGTVAYDKNSGSTGMEERRCVPSLMQGRQMDVVDVWYSRRCAGGDRASSDAVVLNNWFVVKCSGNEGDPVALLGRGWGDEDRAVGRLSRSPIIIITIIVRSARKSFKRSGLKRRLTDVVWSTLVPFFIARYRV